MRHALVFLLVLCRLAHFASCGSCAFQELPVRKISTFDKLRAQFDGPLRPAKLFGVAEKWKSANWTLESISEKLGDVEVWPRDLRNSDPQGGSRIFPQAFRDVIAEADTNLVIYETVFCPITLAMQGYYSVPKPFQKALFAMPVFGWSRNGSGVGLHRADNQGMWGSWYAQVHGSTRWALQSSQERPKSLWPWPEPEATSRDIATCSLERGDAMFVPADYFRSWYGTDAGNLLFGFQGPETIVPKLDALLEAVTKGDASSLSEAYRETAKGKSDPQFTLACVSHAMQAGHMPILKQLHAMGAAFDEDDPSGYTHLHLAAWMGQADAIRFAMQRGADATVRRQKDGNYAIHNAAHAGHVSVLKVLLSKGGRAPWKYKDQSGKTPLHLAAVHGHSAAVKTLLDHRASLSVKDGEGFQALHWAVEVSQPHVVDQLIRMRADIDAGNSDGESPLYRSAIKGHLSIAKQLLDHRANIESESTAGRRTMHVAAYLGHLQIVKMLQSRGAELTPAVVKGQYSPEGLAASAGHQEVLDHLRMATLGKEKSAPPEQSIHAALQAGHYSMLESVLRLQPGPGLKSEDVRFALAGDVIRHGHLTMLKRLTNDGRDLLRKEEQKQESNILLQKAAKHGQIEILKWLVNAGVTVNAVETEKGGDRPLLIATGEGHVPVVKLLVAFRAEVEHENKEGISAVHAAVMKGKAKLTAALLQGGGMAPNKESGRQHLHVAAAIGHTKVAQVIVDSRADVMAQDKGGFPPHFLAAEHGHLAVLRYLLSKNANLDHAVQYDVPKTDTDTKNVTAFSIAVGKGHIPLLKFWLQNHSVEAARQFIKTAGVEPPGHGKEWAAKLEEALELDKREQGAKTWEQAMNDPKQRERIQQFSKAYEKMSPTEREAVDKQMAARIEADEAKQAFEHKQQSKRVSRPVGAAEL